MLHALLTQLLLITLAGASVPQAEQRRVELAGYKLSSPNLVSDCSRFGNCRPGPTTKWMGLFTKAAKFGGADWRDRVAERVHLETPVDSLDSLVADEREWRAHGEDTTLRQVLIMHRHGDRTPIVFESRDRLKTEPLWAFYGYSQLTNQGVKRLYTLGRLLRKRYNTFLNSSANRNARISRSSGALRCIESAQAMLAGLLALDEPNTNDSAPLRWGHEGLGAVWQPVSVLSVPPPMDGMLAEGGKCKRLADEYAQIDKSPKIRSLFNTFQKEAQVIRDLIGYQMEHFWEWYWSDSGISIEEMYYLDKLPQELLDAAPRIELASNKALTAYQMTHVAKRFRSGLLIDDMLSNMHLARALGKAGAVGAKKLIHYSSHDLNLVSLLGVLGVWNQFTFRPDYGASVILELHQDARDIWFVKFFYLPRVPSKPIQFRVEACERLSNLGYCSLTNLERVMQPFRVDGWMNWMSECGNDLSTLNPYVPSD